MRLSFTRTLLLGAIGTCLALSHSLAQAGDAQNISPIRVMSFNIRYASSEDGDNRWENRSDRVASTILFHKSDLVGLQEVTHRQLTDLENALSGYSWVGVGRNDGKLSGEIVPIFYRNDRFELVDKSYYWHSETPDVPGSKSWDAAITRVSTVAKLRDKTSGQELVFLNTHFDHRGAEARRHSSMLLLERITQAGDLPVLVTGDFNCTRESDPYKVLTNKSDGQGFQPLLFDARFRSELPHHGGDQTFTGFVEPRGSSIDYIFVTDNVKVLSHGILTDKWDGRYPSDHFPVLAEVLLPAAGK